MQAFKRIKLVNGGYTLVEEQDFEQYSAFRWYGSPYGYAYRYAQRDGKLKPVFLHREINGTPPHLFTDHINRNRLDNRRSNLRTATGSQNQRNRTKWSAPCSSRFKGVGFDKKRQRWRARVQAGAIVRASYHLTEQQAALDYNRMARELHGEFAGLNELPAGIIPTVKAKTSRFRGVHFNTLERKWKAQIWVCGDNIALGTFTSETDAALAYNAGARQHFGNAAKLNRL